MKATNNPMAAGIIIFFKKSLKLALKYSKETDIHGCTGDTMYPMKMLKNIRANGSAIIASTPYFEKYMGKRIDTGTCTLPVANPRIAPITTRRIAFETASDAITPGVSDASNMFKNRNMPMIIRAKFHGFIFSIIPLMPFNPILPKYNARAKLMDTPIKRYTSGMVLSNIIKER